MKIRITLGESAKLRKSGDFICFGLEKECIFSVIALSKKIVSFASSFDLDELFIEFSEISEAYSRKLFNHISAYRTASKATFEIKTSEGYVLSSSYSLMISLYESYSYAVNTCSTILNPDSFVSLMKAEIEKYNLSGVSFEETLVKDDSVFPAINAVGKGGHHLPRLVVIKFGSAERYDNCLVGKGVCYDSGGLCIKPASAMHFMHIDMAGAALAFFSSLATYLLYNRPVVCVLPIVENLIDSKSYRTGDVINTYAGKTVFVGNTDAEGRLILADAVAYASDKLNYTSLVVMATLTGACKIALGDEYAAYLTSCDAMAEKIALKGKSCGEYVWRLPMDSRFIKTMCAEASGVADISNHVPEAGAGTIMGGVFIEHFHKPSSEGVTFTHFDVASVYKRPLIKGHSGMWLLEFMTSLTSGCEIV